MNTPDIPRVKLLELPLLELGGSTIDLAPMLSLVLLFVLALAGLATSSSRLRRVLRFCTRALGLFIFVFAAHQTMCVLRAWVFGFEALGRNDTVAFALLHIAMVLIFMALVAGNIFCGWICPVGTLQEWIGRPAAQAKRSLPAWLVRLTDWTITIFAIVVMIRLCVLYAPSSFFFSENVSALFTIAGLLMLPALLAAPYLDRRLRRFRYLSLFGRLGIVLIGIHATNPGCTLYETEVDYSAAISFLGVILATIVLTRAYCRYVCPFGAAFGLLSRAAIVHVAQARGGCSKLCGRCGDTCPTGALDPRSIDDEACIRCGRCLDHCGCSVVTDLGIRQQAPAGTGDDETIHLERRYLAPVMRADRPSPGPGTGAEHQCPGGTPSHGTTGSAAGPRGQEQEDCAARCAAVTERNGKSPMPGRTDGGD